MKRITLILMVLAFLPCFVVAQNSSDEMFAQANAAYDEGHYDAALNLYTNIIEMGQESVPLYFNMGNAYYKLRSYPMAIYYYEKALKLDPSNDDVRTNLEIANLAIADKIEPVPQSFISKGWNDVKNLFSVNMWAVLSVVLLALFLTSLYLFFRSRRMGIRKLGFFVGLILLLLFVLSFVFSMEKYQMAQAEDHAIVVTPTVTVKSSPNGGSVDLFVLHEGTKIQILDKANGWNKVRIANGSEGWLPEDSSVAF